MSTPTMTAGGVSVDDRGKLSYINDFRLGGYKRFYLVSNHRAEFVRAWHGHKHESKAVVVVKGSAIVAAVEIDDWESPSADLPVHRYVMSADKPSVLEIPAGFANGFMTLTPDAIVCFYSSATLDESANDDFRFAADLWQPWAVEER